MMCVYRSKLWITRPYGAIRIKGGGIALALAIAAAPGCRLQPLEPQSSTHFAQIRTERQGVSLRLVLPESRKTSYVAASRLYRIEVRATDLADPIQAEVSDTAGRGELFVGGVPVGQNRVIALQGLSDSGAPIPGAEWMAVTAIGQEFQSVLLSPATTAVGRVWRRWLDQGQGALATSSDPTLVLAKLERLKSAETVPHFALLDAERWADEVAITGQMTEQPGGFGWSAGRIGVSLEGAPTQVPATIWVDDPVSPRQIALPQAPGVLGVRHEIGPVLPGRWSVWATIPGIGTASASVVVEAGRDTPAALVFPHWRPGPELPAAIGNAAIASDGRFIFVVGGVERGGAATDSAWVLDSEASTKAWRPLPSLPLPREGATATTLGNRLFVQGGDVDGRGPSADALVLATENGLASGRWAVSFPPSSDTDALIGDRFWPLGSATTGNSFFTLWTTAGDGAEEAAKGQVLEFVSGAEEWTTDPPGIGKPRTPRDRAAMALYDDPQDGKRCVVAGGDVPSGGGGFGHTPLARASSLVEAFDLFDGRWLSLPDLPTPRSELALAQAAGLLYAAGGVDGLDRALDVVERYSPVSGWLPAPPLSNPRSRFGLVFAGGLLWAIGGSPSYRLNREISGGALALSGVETFDPGETR